MQREPLYKARVLSAVSNLEYYARLMARSPVVGHPDPLPTNRTDPISRVISIFTGFVDGSFQA